MSEDWDARFNALEKKIEDTSAADRRYLSQRLETHFGNTNEKIAKVLAASETAHKEIIERLERLENK